ncbi:hypothetical protein GJ496_005415 [Pomphorhynchus laevis]|nr:hypothetical protein GJ496_005415 [Pomphorhynchus laevis]
MAKGKSKTKGLSTNTEPEKTEILSAYGDNADTNKPQAEEKDLHDLLRDIELQYEEEESKRKKGRKKHSKKQELENKELSDADEPDSIPNQKLSVNKSKPKKASKSQKHEKPENKIDDTDFKKEEAIQNNDQVNSSELVGNLAKIKVHPDVDSVKSQQKSKGKSSKQSNAKSKQIELIKQALAKQKEIEAQMLKDEEDQFKREEELEKLREAKLEEERIRKQKRKEKDKARIQKKKEMGIYLTREQKEKKDRALLQLKLAGVLPSITVDDDKKTDFKKPRRKAKKGQKEMIQEDVQSINEDESPVLSLETVVTLEESADDIKDCWDDDTDNELPLRTSDIHKPNSAAGTYQQDYVSTDQDDDDDDSSSYESESEDEDIRCLPTKERAAARIKRRKELAEQRVRHDDLRCPVICVMGHVDTGKTKMLDNLRKTHVQDGEAGGITQQIGATNVPLSTIQERTKHCAKCSITLPGFIFVDTPGHESFKNLRVRGSSLCDIAILIVDLMHGIEPQTIESLQLLRSRRCPFVIALNKIDRLNGWESNPTMPITELINRQAIHTKNDFDRRYKQTIVQLAQQKVNAALFYDNPDPKSFYPMIPVSAVSGDGVGDLMFTIVDACQNALASKLAFSEDLKCTVMEVKSIEGFGTTIDICLVNGRLRVGDTIVVPGQEGPIVTQIRGLMMPAHNKDLRVKNQYQIYKEVKGTRGVKIAAKNLEKAMAGLPLYVAVKEDEIEIYQDELRVQLKSVLSSFATQDTGVYVQASTLGSLEALLAFLNSSKIPFSGLNIGPVHRYDVTRASVMLEKDSQWAVILAFDVRVDREAQEIADNLGVKIFTADIIYHLFDKFMAYRDELKLQNKEKHKHLAVFPCVVKIIPQYVFNTRDPIVVGVLIERGFLKIATPLCVVKEDHDEPILIGRVSSIEFNHKSLEIAKVGQEVCIKIEPWPGESPKMIGRHFEITDPLISKISRESIDTVKEFFRDEMQKADWQLTIDLKQKLKII